jgi:hypothetical protein
MQVESYMFNLCCILYPVCFCPHSADMANKLHYLIHNLIQHRSDMRKIWLTPACKLSIEAMNHNDIVL